MDVTYCSEGVSIAPMDSTWAPSLGLLSFNGKVDVEGYRFAAATLSGTIPGDLELSLGYDPLSVSETVNIALQMYVQGREPIDLDMMPYPVSVADSEAFAYALMNGTAALGMDCVLDGCKVVSIDGVVAEDGYGYAVYRQSGDDWVLYDGGPGTRFTVVYDKVFDKEGYDVLPPRQKASYCYDEATGYAYRIPDSAVSDYVYNIYLQLHDPTIKRPDLVTWLDPYYTGEQGRYTFAGALTSGLDAAGITYSISKSGTIGMIGGYVPREGPDGTYGFTIYMYDGSGYILAESTEPAASYMVVFDRILDKKEFDALSPEDRISYHAADRATMLPRCTVGCSNDHSVFVDQAGSSVDVLVSGDGYVPRGTVALKISVSYYDPLLGFTVSYHEYKTVYAESDGSDILRCSVDLGKEPYYLNVFSVKAVYTSEGCLIEAESAKVSLESD